MPILNKENEVEQYIQILEEVVARQEWSTDDNFWFSPGERDILHSVWSFFCDNQTSPSFDNGPKNIWLKKEDGSPLNFKVKPCYALDSMELIGLTLLFDRSKTSEEDIFSTLVYHAKVGDLTKHPA
jgi:hypothetical protein